MDLKVKTTVLIVDDEESIRENSKYLKQQMEKKQ